MATASLIVRSYLRALDIDALNDQHYKQKVDELLEQNKKGHGTDFLIPLNFHLSLLENTDEVLFPYMSPAKKAIVLHDLKICYLLLLTEKKYELTHQKTENESTLCDQLKKCKQFIDVLNYKKVCEEEQIQPSPEYGYETDSKPVGYLERLLGPRLAKKIDELTIKTKALKDAMGWFNEKRLGWVWSSVLLKTVLDLFPPDFFNIAVASTVVRTPDPYTGAISWSLYYFRFALNLCLLLKHTIPNPWMSTEEMDLPWEERFGIQWAQRKFTLLNDSIWATGNLLCYFKLTGLGSLGTWGDVLTLALLVFDISLAIWDFDEQEIQYNNEINGFNADILAVKKLIKELSSSTCSETENKRLSKIYHFQLDWLERAKNQCKRNWDYQILSLKNNLAYAVGLMLAFALLTIPFLPITGPLAIAMTTTGAVLCFVFSVINNAIKSYIEIHKAKMSGKEACEDYGNKIDDFNALMKINSDPSDIEKKCLFLEIKKALAEIDYQHQMKVFLSVHLFRSFLIEALTPALIFGSLVFLPLSMGLASLGAVLAIAISSHLIINRFFEPKKESLKSLDDTEYAAFYKNPETLSVKTSKAKQGFFNCCNDNKIFDRTSKQCIIAPFVPQ